MTGKKLLIAAALVALTGTAASAAPAVVEADLNVRAGRGTGNPVVGVFPAGTVVDARDCARGWCFAAGPNAEGYVSANYLSFSGAAPGAAYIEPEPDYYYDYAYPTYSYAYPAFGLGFYSGPDYRYRYWRGHGHSWRGRHGNWRGRTGNWRARTGQPIVGSGQRGPRASAGPIPSFSGGMRGQAAPAAPSAPSAGGRNIGNLR